MFQDHKKKWITIGVIVIFVGIRYGIIRKGDIASIVTDIRELVHEFRETTDEVLNGKPEATKPQRSKNDRKAEENAPDSAKAKQ